MSVSTIVAGYDLSAPSDAALARAVGLATAYNAKLVVVHAQADDTPIDRTNNELVDKLGEVSAVIRAQEAVKIADRIAGIHKQGIGCELVSRAGPPGEILATVATEKDADLLVIGTHGHTGLARFLLGSVAAATLRHAPCDVLVCRGPAGGAFKKPLVAMDFSAAATRAVSHVVELCEPQAAIDVVHAWQLPAGSWGATLLGQARFPWSTVRDAVVASAQTQADRLVLGQKSLGRSLHVELVQGPPASVVTSAAERGGWSGEQHWADTGDGIRANHVFSTIPLPLLARLTSDRKSVV